MAVSVLDKLVTILLGFQTDTTALRRFDRAIGNTRKRLDGLSSQAFGIGRTIGIAGGVATGAFGLAAKQAIEWESDFTGVRKTVNATEEEFAFLEETPAADGAGGSAATCWRPWQVLLKQQGSWGIGNCHALTNSSR